MFQLDVSMKTTGTIDLAQNNKTVLTMRTQCENIIKTTHEKYEIMDL